MIYSLSYFCVVVIITLTIKSHPNHSTISSTITSSIKIPNDTA